MTTDWNALLGLSEYVVTVKDWPRQIPVAASSAEGAVAKARTACAATTMNKAWLTADATAVPAGV
jgi:hypothetical protein